MKYVSIGFEQLTIDNWKSPKNMMFVKPSGGIWASTYTPDEPYISAWYQFCVSEDFNIERLTSAVVFEVLPTARIYTVDSLTDLVWLMDRYKNNSGPKYYTSLDFEKIAIDYDAIHLTEKGQWKTRMSEPNLYGWDVESLLVLNFDVITNQETITIKQSKEI